MDTILRDIRLAVRLLWKDRAFTATTVATLALCLAANAAIFGVVRSVLLRPLPFPEADRILTMDNAYPQAGAYRGASGVPDDDDRLRETDVFEEIALYRTNGVTLGGLDHGAERLTGMVDAPTFFRLPRARPFRGRLFEESDAEPGRKRKVVLSFGLWRRLFGGRDEAVGRTLRIEGEPYDVVGVLPDGFRFVDPDVQVWLPAAFTPADRSDDRRHRNNWQMIARLKPGATIAQAQSQIDALNARNLERFPALEQLLLDAGFHTPVFVFQDELVAEARPALLLLWGGVLVVLAIGCVNIATILQPPPRERWLTVVGVVPDVKLASLTSGGASGALGAYYLAARQFPPRTFTLAIRTSLPPERATRAVQAAVASVDPELPLYNVRTMEQLVDGALVDRRTPMLLAIAFATVALFLSAIGLYGTLAFHVAQRRREVGVRMALGATGRSIAGLILREATLIVGLGWALGLGGAVLLRDTLQSQLYGVSPLDPRVLAAVAIVLGAVAVAACLVPARSASRTDPIRALAE